MNEVIGANKASTDSLSHPETTSFQDICKEFLRTTGDQNLKGLLKDILTIMQTPTNVLPRESYEKVSKAC